MSDSTLYGDKTFIGISMDIDLEVIIVDTSLWVGIMNLITSGSVQPIRLHQMVQSFSFYTLFAAVIRRAAFNSEYTLC